VSEHEKEKEQEEKVEDLDLESEEGQEITERIRGGAPAQRPIS
jgi:hypothetical protein